MSELSVRDRVSPRYEFLQWMTHLGSNDNDGAYGRFPSQFLLDKFLKTSLQFNRPVDYAPLSLGTCFLIFGDAWVITGDEKGMPRDQKGDEKGMHRDQKGDNGIGRIAV